MAPSVATPAAMDGDDRAVARHAGDGDVVGGAVVGGALPSTVALVASSRAGQG